MKKNMSCAVVIATYNGEMYIKEQLESILSQSRVPDRIVVTDDGSVDNTLDICQNILSNSDVQYVITVNKENHGVSSNFFNGINQCKEDVIFFSDQDDIWVYDKIEIMMNKFECFPKCVMVMSDAYIWPSGSTDFSKTIFNNLKLYTLFDEDGKYVKDLYERELIFRNFATGMCMAIRSDIAKYQKCDLKMFHDTWYNLFSTVNGEIYFIQQPLAYYRQHINNVQGMKTGRYFCKIKSFKKNNLENIEKRIEKLELMCDLQRSFTYLNNENEHYLRQCLEYTIKRKLYISKRNFFSMVCLVLKEKKLKYYPTYLFTIRDILSSLF